MPGTSTKPAMILINLSAVACIANELTWQREVPVSIVVDIHSRLGLVMQPLNPLNLANENPLSQKSINLPPSRSYDNSCKLAKAENQAFQSRPSDKSIFNGTWYCELGRLSRSKISLYEITFCCPASLHTSPVSHSLTPVVVQTSWYTIHYILLSRNTHSIFHTADPFLSQIRTL